MTIKNFYCLLFGEYDPFVFDNYYGEILLANEADEKILERRTAAYMSYVYISEVMNEPDEPDIGPAFVLKDIYECPACIRYIAQVYLKGIMEGKASLFGVRNPVEEAEAKMIARRVKNRSCRFRF